MTYNQKKHHRRSIRLKGYDYSQPGGYFITICAQGMLCIFGRISKGAVELTPIGEWVKRSWLEIPNYFPMVDLDEFEIMPNHMHGIIFINDIRRGEVTSPLLLQSTITLGKIVAYFKYMSTKMTNQMQKTPGERLWQRNFYERIIRTEDELNRIRYNIINNPVKLEFDKENPYREW